ncbi:MAG: RNA polymerase sigma factor [Chitinophagales bacterium]
MRSKKYTLNEWLELIKSGDEKTITELYETYRKEFFVWIKNKYQCTDEEALDAYQESVLVLYNNVKKGKLIKFTSSIKTYLFAIGRNVVLYNRRKFQREQSGITDKEIGRIADSESAQVNLQISDSQKILMDTLNEMTNTCKSLIMLYYTHNLPFKKIAKKLGYKSETVARMQKMRCMKKMKVLVKGRYKKEDLY